MKTSAALPTISKPASYMMLYTQTVEKLRALRLEGMVQALEEQRQQSNILELDFEDRLALLVERQCLWKENRGLALRLKSAHFKIGNACLEDLDYRPSRGLKRGQIDQLRASQWIEHHRNCMITGPTGTGKTHLACALGAQVCRDGYHTHYYHAPKLFRELEIARADGSMPALLKRLSRTTLLIVDDLGISNVTGKLYREFLEILDDRQGQGSTIITSQFPVSQWHEIIGDATVADAILDRLVHNAYRLELKGESLRKNKPDPSEKK
jgi:DNA replication protein DnaC